mmetsp:Transcript_9756/g.30339  ORF Transcript_9756/g.30339 Transcript_9756/m.30339 type:complete len:95 (-) Transcript_9756:253-537(-)
MPRAALCVLAVAAAARANEVCVSKSVLSSSSFDVTEIDSSTKGARCYRLEPRRPTALAAEFWTRDNLTATLANQPWYTYMLVAWVLSASLKYFG